MDEDLVDQSRPRWSVEDFEVGGVQDPAILLRAGFGTWCIQAGRIEPAGKHSEEKYKTGNRKTGTRNKTKAKWTGHVAALK